MKRTHVFACLALAACFAVPASADVIKIDASTYAAGTDVSNAAPGVTLRILTNDPAAGNNNAPLYAPAVVQPCGALSCVTAGELLSLGTPVFNGSDWEDCYQVTVSIHCSQPWAVLEVAFNEAIDQISIESVWTIDPPNLIALDAAGNEVVSCLSSGPGNPTPQPSSPAGCLSWTQFGSFGTFAGTSTLDVTGLGVERVIFASWAGFGAVTSVSYSVPEPGTLALMALGLAVAFGVRRRKHPHPQVAA